MDYEVVFPLDEEGAGDRAFQIIQQGFTEIGVELTQKKLDNNAAWDAMYCGRTASTGTSISRCGTGSRPPTPTSSWRC